MPQEIRSKIGRLMARIKPYFNRKNLSLALVAVGVVLLGYVASEYWRMYRSQQRLEAEWERQAAMVSSPGQADLSEQEKLTRVVIPKIHLDAIVVEGASRKELSAGPGHMKETAVPGEIGNAVITAHRDTFFRHIYELTKDDQIEVKRNGRTFVYAVTGKRVVMPEDISVIKPTTDAQLTLITCYPTYYIGPAPKRLVVFSHLIDEGGPPDRQTAQSHK